MRPTMEPEDVRDAILIAGTRGFGGGHMDGMSNSFFHSYLHAETINSATSLTVLRSMLPRLSAIATAASLVRRPVHRIKPSRLHRRPAVQTPTARPSRADSAPTPR